MYQAKQEKPNRGWMKLQDVKFVSNFYEQIGRPRPKLLCKADKEIDALNERFARRGAFRLGDEESKEIDDLLNGAMMAVYHRAGAMEVTILKALLAADSLSDKGLNFARLPFAHLLDLLADRKEKGLQCEMEQEAKSLRELAFGDDGLDANSLAESIVQIIQEPERMSRLYARAFEIVRDYYAKQQAVNN